MFFDLFKRKKNKTLSEDEIKWNKMWDLWADGKIESPYNELMSYQSEVNNGGHHQYFLNTDNNGDVRKEFEILCSILPDIMKENLQTAFNTYLELEQDKNTEQNETIIENCDDVFYENEEAINEILEHFAEKL